MGSISNTEQTFDWRDVTVGEAQERIADIDGELVRLLNAIAELETTVFLLECERKTYKWIIERKRK